tara:strand:+ start:254 stop:715 length:462 start_codon:yes stop_codon:yes gene_type:complete
MFFKFKYHIIFIYLSSFIILNACKFQEPTRNHGILFLENRYEQLQVSKSNINDVTNLIGNPHTKSIKNDYTWIYIERVLKKGEYHKLGKNVVKTNNVLVLTFDRYGVLQQKTLLDKEKLAKIKFSEEVTQNNLSKKSFVQEFLSSIKQKMYGK